MVPAPTAPRPEDSGRQSQFRETALASGLVDEASVAAAEAEVRFRIDANADKAARDRALADVLVERGQLSRFQADQMLAGRRKLTLGQYRITDAVGQGGMGQVFKAEHAMMGRVVAVKVLPRAKSTPETEAAFQREIRMLGRLDHENLVRALDAGHDGKVFYLVTEFVAGVDLRKQVARYGTLTDEAAASVITQAARGLAYAHEQGLVHRDVKPGNLLVTEEGRVKVLDLGLAGSVIEEESTRLGRVVGTMDYMAPEQIRSPDTAGPPADVYGLGCTLYFALAGQVPFPGGTRQEKARRQLEEAPIPIRQLAPHVSDGLCSVVDDMMRKSPRERIATAEMVIERLRPWTPDVPVRMARKPVSRHRPLVPSRRAAGPPPLPPELGEGAGAAGRGTPSESNAGSLDQSSSPASLDRDWLAGAAQPESQSSDPAAEKKAGAEELVDRLVTAPFETLFSWPAFRFPVVAVIVGIVVGTSFDVLCRIDPRVGGLLGKASPFMLGRHAFVLTLAAQCLAALAGRGRRG
ncbi:MAG: serine/threonine protein kinase [Planctomycetia bacterium]|nr:serine/threonine protein kinase [Planctomycetia bacterium]